MIGTIGSAAKRRTAGSRSDARGTARGMRRTAAHSIMLAHTVFRWLGEHPIQCALTAVRKSL